MVDLRRDVFLAFVAVLVAACASWGERPAVPNALSDEELKEAGKKIETAIREGDAPFFDPRLDFRGMVDWATERDRSEIALQFRRGFLESREALIRQMHGEVQNGGDYKFMGIKESKDPKTLLFRYITSDNGLNYHEMRVQRRADGDFATLDIFVYVDGAWLSDTARNSFAQVKESVRLAQTPNPTPDELEKIRGEEQAVKFIEVGLTDPARALDIYHGLPEEIRKRRLHMVIRMQCAMKLEDELEYFRTLEDFEAAFPNDPAKEILLLDVFLYRKQFDEMLAGLDDLQELLGIEDAYLHVLRGVAHRLKGDEAKARTVYAKAARLEPGLKAAHIAQLDLALVNKDFDRATQALLDLESRCGVDVDELVDGDAFGDFRDSPAYEKWQTARKKGASAPKTVP